MAVAPTQRFDRSEIDRQVRHPLQALRGYIRLYVTLEGAAVALIYLALWFWIGLLLDYGMFWLFAFDWIQELNQNLPAGTAGALRVGLLVVLLAGLLAVVAIKVLLRLFREFRDDALALVLERRFPRELGDRLITAVELADPRLADHYGYSQALVDTTIRDAAERVGRLPVRGVFDWTRLRRQWFIVLALTLGVYLLTALGVCTLPRLFGADAPTPGGFVWGMCDVSSIGLERQVLLQNSYWPRSALLEVIRFQDTSEHPGEMRVGRDEQRPEVLVRAVKWTIADPQAPDGWRAMRWSDCRNIRNLPTNLVTLPPTWSGWAAGPDDFDRGGPDWRTWTVDRIELQLERRQVREALRTNGQESSLKAFEQVFQELAGLADSPAMSRHLRQLDVPAEVKVYFRGKNTKSSNSHARQENHTYSITLNELKESAQFTVRARDYYTPPLTITLVPPPSLSRLTVTKEEPAYLYYRLQGDQKLLKGKKQVFRDQVVSITGDSSSIQVPLGSRVQVMARADRELNGEVRLAAPAQREETGSLTPIAAVHWHEDGRTFSTQFENITRTLEFDFEFTDRDRVKGHRRILIKPIDDRPPEILDVEMGVSLRKPRFRSDSGKSGEGLSADGFLVTPRALIPFKGTLRDDYGLTEAAWAFEYEPVEFELMGEGSKQKGGLVMGGTSAVRRAHYVGSGMQFLPGVYGSFAPATWAWIAQLVRVDIALSARRQPEKGQAPLQRFQKRLEDRAGEELTLAALAEKLNGPPPRSGLLKEHSLKEEEGFDFNKVLPQLQAKDPQKEAQLHYQVRLTITATDNNVETGPGVGRTKVPINFLIVSENELLAQVLVEEDGLRERLEKAVQALRFHKTVLDEQATKVDDPKTDLGLVGLRVEDVRKSILDGSSTTREVYSDYSRILKELEANRVSADKIQRVEGQICKPLEEVLDPKAGEFSLADDWVQKLAQTLAQDPKTVNRMELRTSTEEARRRMTNLLDRLEGVLRAMDQELVEGKVIQILVEVEREVRKEVNQIEDLRRQQLLELFRELGEGDELPLPPKKK